MYPTRNLDDAVHNDRMQVVRTVRESEHHQARQRRESESWEWDFNDGGRNFPSVSNLRKWSESLSSSGAESSIEEFCPVSFHERIKCYPSLITLLIMFEKVTSTGFHNPDESDRESRRSQLVVLLVSNLPDRRAIPARTANNVGSGGLPSRQETVRELPDWRVHWDPWIRGRSVLQSGQSWSSSVRKVSLS